MRVAGHNFAIAISAVAACFGLRGYPGVHNYHVGYDDDIRPIGYDDDIRPIGYDDDIRPSPRNPRKLTFVETPNPLSKRARRRARGKGKAR